MKNSLPPPVRTSVIMVVLLLCASTLFRCQLNPYEQGQKLYQTHCQACHGSDGLGFKNLYPPLTHSTLLQRDPAQIACIIRYGKTDNLRSAQIEMPAYPIISEEDMPNLINFLIHQWSTENDSRRFVTPSAVHKALLECADHKSPKTQ